MKKNQFPHAISLLLVLCLFVSTASATMQKSDFIQPRYTGIAAFDVRLTISSSGYAECFSRVKSATSTDTIDLTMELQRSTDGESWDTIKSWDTSDSGTAYLDKGWYVSSGYSYRVHAIAEVNTSSGTLAETAPADSLVIDY